MVSAPTRLAIARARKRYDAGAPTNELAQRFGVTVPTFRRWRKQWGWPARPRRGVASDTADISAASANTTTPTDAPDTADLIRGVRRAIEAELKALGAQSGNPRGGEARSRALAHLTRTLTLVRELEKQTERAGRHDDTDADTPPVDVAELRHELARRIHQLSETGDDR